MKAIGFFCAVFFSMLFVFLLATGELARWISDEGDPYSLKVDLSSEGGEGTENLIRFDFYNVELGRRSFSIRAEFRQDDFQIETQIETIRQLVFHNGVIEIPVSSRGLSGEGDPTASRLAPVQNVLLSFDTATYLRGEQAESEHGRFQVLLKNGQGTTDDGTEFDFEELVFSDNVPEQPDGNRGGFLLESDKPVSVRNPSLKMMSPAGFRGILGSHGLRSFTFLPPVRAILDPRQPSFLDLGKDAVGAKGLQQEPTVEKPAGPGESSTPGEATSAPDETGTLIAVGCDGPLSVEFEEKAQGEQGSRPGRTIVKFRKDVVLYAVEEGVNVDSLPPPAGNRFECQELQIELDSAGQRLTPRRALATWEGGRVRAVLHRKTGGEEFTIEGDRLEWILRDETGDTASEGEPASQGTGGERSISKAVLYGRPTLSGQEMEFVAERAVFLLNQNRVLLEDVRGDLRHQIQDAGSSRQRTVEEQPAWSPPSIPPWEEELSGAEASRIMDPVPVPEPTLEPAEQPDGQIPDRWRMEADEVEFVFDARKGEDRPGSIGHELSSFVARSRSASGVVIQSATEKPDPDSEAADLTDGSGAAAFRMTGRTLTYLEGEKRFTLDGTPDVKPRLSKGENWIEAQKIQLFTEAGVARFEGEVLGHAENLTELKPRDSTSRTDPEEPTGESGPDLEKASFELRSDTLTLRRQPGRNALRDLWGSGSTTSPLVVTSLSSPWFRLSGPQIYWDQEQGVAQLASFPDDPAQSSQAVPAKVEFESGEVLADRIRFDRARWTAYLSDRVRIQTLDRSESTDKEPLEIVTARAVVEFFPGFEEHGVSGGGLLRQLQRIRQLHAYSTADRPIVIQRSDFVGRAEECTWNAELGELRFFGAERQEIELLHEDFQGPTRAREVVYDAGKQMVTLRGDVEGHIIQSALPTDIAGDMRDTRIQRASVRTGTDPDRSPMLWQFNTTELEIRLREQPQGSGLALQSLRARDKVYLRNESLRVQLRGDDLVYDDTTHKIHIFSPDGRPQTLLCDRFGSLEESAPEPVEVQPGGRPKTDSRMDKVHKIVSQEIWLLLYENPHATPRRGEPGEWLLAEFNRDVMASFYLPSDSQDNRLGNLDVGDTWKMVAEKLTLHIDPSQTMGPGGRQRLQRLIPWAVAAGQVVFTSGSYQATADRAIYEDPHQKVTLIGSPARLSQDSRTVEEAPEMLLRMEGREIVYTPGRARGRSPVPTAPPARE